MKPLLDTYSIKRYNRWHTETCFAFLFQTILLKVNVLPQLRLNFSFLLIVAKNIDRLNLALHVQQEHCCSIVCMTLYFYLVTQILFSD